MLPKVSVIVPVYNVEKYLEHCVESIINQTYVNLEIILVNDGSPDNCGKIIDEYAADDERILLFIKIMGAYRMPAIMAYKQLQGNTRCLLTAMIG